MMRISEAMIAAKGDHFDESKVKELLVQLLFNAAQEDLYLV